jgi:phosphopantetheinyl transferase
MKIEEIQYNEAKVLIGCVEEDIQSLKNQLKNIAIYEEEYSKIKTDKRKIEFLAARILLNKAAEKEVQVIYNEDNKPYLKDKSSFISITHSKNYVAVIIHPSCQVGIDIELRTDRVKNIVKRFLNIREQSIFSKENNKLEIAWSAKEALFKIIGNKVRDFAAELEIFQFTVNEKGKLYVLHVSGSRIYKLRYYQNEIYTLVLCVDKRIKL